MRTKDRKNRTDHHLEGSLTFDAITAWQVCELQRYARDAPDTPAEHVLSPLERQVIWTFVLGLPLLLPPQQRGLPPPEDIRSWVVILARLAGWQPSKRRPQPGKQVLWRAWQKVVAGVHYKQLEQIATDAGTRLP